jgi:hypothetical protein
LAIPCLLLSDYDTAMLLSHMNSLQPEEV